ncbi:hypothetical protein CYMTET_19509 [Cymbomonas tetramitiformis]|uniref:non-specific serine/threonine protein kinase n=1 Tax=Cymbomonas tetramitiformis TaxID=36881 RepID=A0AAE0G5Y3_9CHLO|nr:hypothetical protein CYMTET_19509 [Cymbomonas tetramitiformis]
MDRYKIVDRIGEGAFGKVYKAKDLQDEHSEPVVIKVVNLPQKKEERDFCLREIELLAAIHHPCLVHCKDTFSEHERLCIVMPFYAGGDLSKQLKRNIQRKLRLPEQVFVEWFAQATLALEHLHAQHILHRDIKCDNCFMQKVQDSNKVAVLLGDFGVSRVLEFTNAQAQTQCGTPYYMSPELFKGVKYSNKSDIWALGCVFYEVIAQKVPFTANSLAELANAVMNKDPPPLPGNYSVALRQVRPAGGCIHLPTPQWESVGQGEPLKLVMSMLDKDPAKRPSASDVAKHPALERATRNVLEEHVGPEDEVTNLSSSICFSRQYCVL